VPHSPEGERRPSFSVTPEGRASLVSARSGQNSVDAVVQMFLEAHPDLTSEVWKLAPGQWVVRGRVVVRLTDAYGLVSVDGGQQPLGEFLEHSWQEFTLEQRTLRAMRRATIGRQIMGNLLDVEARRGSEQLLRSCLQALHRELRLRRILTALSLRSGKWLLRNYFIVWCSTCQRMERANLIDRFIQGTSARRNDCNDSKELFFWLWCVFCQIEGGERVSTQHAKAAEGSIHRLRWLRGSFRAMAEQLIGSCFNSVCSACFWHWSNDVQWRRRQHTEAFLWGQTNCVRQEIELVGRQTCAKDWLLSSFEGPEAQLSRLSCIVEGIRTELDVKTNNPIVASAVHRAAAKNTETWQDTLKAFESLAQARRVVEKLQSDIGFVLQVRSFSGWLRATSDARIERGQASIAVRSEVLAEMTQEITAKRLSYHFGVQKEALSRESFTLWVALTTIQRSIRQGQAVVHLQEEKVFNEKLTILRIECYEASRKVAVKVMKNCALLDLTTIVRLWFIEMREAKSQRVVDDLLERARRTTQAADAAHLAFRILAGNNGMVKAREQNFRNVFACWHKEAHSQKLRRHHLRRRDTILSQRDAWATNQFHKHVHMMTARWRHFARSRRIALKNSKNNEAFVNGTASMSLLSTCFTSWSVEVRSKKAEAKTRRLSELSSSQSIRMMHQADQATQFVQRVQKMSGMRRSFEAWVESMLGERRNMAATAQASQMDSFSQHVELVKNNARKYQLRAGSRFYEAFRGWILKVSIAEWAIASREASRIHQAASHWLHRKKQPSTKPIDEFQLVSAHGRVKRLTLRIVDAHVHYALLQCFVALRCFKCSLRFGRHSVTRYFEKTWRYRIAEALAAWRLASVRYNVRQSAVRLGESAVLWSDISHATRALISWRGASQSRSAQKKLERFALVHTLSKLVLRGPRAALRQWENNASITRHGAMKREKAMLRQRGLILLDAKQSRLTRHAEKHVLHVMLLFLDRHRRAEVGKRSEKKLCLAHSFMVWQHGVADEKYSRLWGNNARNFKNDAQDSATACMSKSRAKIIIGDFADITPGNLMPKCFASWVLAVQETVLYRTASEMAQKAVALDARYKSAVENLFGRSALRLRQRVLLEEFWLRFVQFFHEGRCYRVRQHRENFLRGRISDISFRLAGRLAKMVLENGGSECFLAWATHRHQVAHSSAVAGREAFGQKAVGMARRVLAMNQRAHGLTCAASAWVAWRCFVIAVTRAGLARRAKTCVVHAQQIGLGSLWRLCFSRWLRCAWVARTAAVPLGLIFVAWRAWRSGASISAAHALLAGKATAQVSRSLTQHRNMVIQLSAFHSWRAALRERGQNAFEAVTSAWLTARRSACFQQRQQYVQVMLELRQVRQRRCVEAWCTACRAARRHGHISRLLTRPEETEVLMVWAAFALWSRHIQLSRWSRMRTAEVHLSAHAKKVFAAAHDEVLMRIAFCAWLRGHAETWRLQNRLHSMESTIEVARARQDRELLNSWRVGVQLRSAEWLIAGRRLLERLRYLQAWRAVALGAPSGDVFALVGDACAARQLVGLIPNSSGSASRSRADCQVEDQMARAPLQGISNSFNSGSGSVSGSSGSSSRSLSPSSSQRSVNGRAEGGGPGNLGQRIASVDGDFNAGAARAIPAQTETHVPVWHASGVPPLHATYLPHAKSMARRKFNPEWDTLRLDGLYPSSRLV